MKTLSLVVGGLSLVCLGGCARSRAESSYQKVLDLVDEMSVALERSKTVKEAKPKIEKISYKLRVAHDEVLRLFATEPTIKEVTDKQLKYLNKLKNAIRRVNVWERVLAARDRENSAELVQLLAPFRETLARPSLY